MGWYRKQKQTQITVQIFCAQEIMKQGFPSGVNWDMKAPQTEPKEQRSLFMSAGRKRGFLIQDEHITSRGSRMPGY